MGEQKSDKCHWPVCNTEFARQRDCKRHEQLHSNYWPFECEGCGTKFARMDTLNKHLRSEGGAEGAKEVAGEKKDTMGGEEVKPVVGGSTFQRRIEVWMVLVRGLGTVIWGCWVFRFVFLSFFAR